MRLVYILLILAFIKSVVMYKVYHSIPQVELKRRARRGDKKAIKLYKVAAYEDSLDLFLWITGIASGTILFIWSARTNWWLAAAVIFISVWMVISAKFTINGWAGSLAAFVAPAHSRIMAFLQPVFGRAAGLLPHKSLVSIHTGLYEREDLLKLLDNQNKQIDNRIPVSDLQIAGNAMTFGDKQVGQVMTPRRQVKLVGVDDSIGPLLMDELHKSGFSRFPVVKDSSKSSQSQVIGTLYLNNLIGYEGGGKVKDLAKKEVYFINEASNLRQALSAFLKTHHHLLIVINSFEEMVGVLSLEDVLEEIIGNEIVDEFDNYDDLRAVAANDAKKQHIEEKHQEVPPAPQELP